jgi:predicted dehydrogenase
MRISRRTFVKSSAIAATGALAVPNLISCKANSKINIAIIGVGGRAEKNWALCLEENIVALCDVDDKMAANGFKQFPNARRFKDFRVMFDKMEKEIDAVMISTPNHTHFAATMAAMQLGKHVYVEKPLAHDIWQLRTLKKAAHYYNVVTQMGNQGHATDGIRRIKEWYEAGILGEVKEVFAWHNGPNLNSRYFRTPNQFPPQEEQIPDTLNWDLWLGQAQQRPYNSCYHPRLWRGWYPFGNGLIGDWACHTIDGPFWSLDPGIPNVAEAEMRTPSAVDFIPQQSVIKMEFPARNGKPQVTFKWMEGGTKPEIRPEWHKKELLDTGMIMVGDKRSLITGGRPDNVTLLISEDEKKSIISELPEPSIPRIEGGPQQEWIRAIKGDGPEPGSNFDYAADLTEVSLLGALAQRTNKRIEYDATKMKVTNHPGFEQYIKEPVRKGWEYGEEIWR